MKGVDLWSDGLICAFELVRGGKRRTANSRSNPKSRIAEQTGTEVRKMDHSGREQNNGEFKSSERNINDVSGGHNQGKDCCSGHFQNMEDMSGSCWMPIGWARISKLVQKVQCDAAWASQSIDWADEEGNVTAADVAAPYWERPVGPSWWCHVEADYPFIRSWLSGAQWLHPAISITLLDETRLISERMKYLFYEISLAMIIRFRLELRVGSYLSCWAAAGDPYVNEDDMPTVLRSWQALNSLINSLHVKGCATNINVFGIAGVQELLAAGGCNIPRNTHEIIAHLACRLARWDDRLFRKNIFGAADEIELMFMNRRTHEDLQLFSIILNQELRRPSTQVIRVKWSLHAREEIVFELLQHLKGSAAKGLLEGVRESYAERFAIRKSTREMIEEVRGRLFTIQDVMQSAVRAWLQEVFWS